MLPWLRNLPAPVTLIENVAYVLTVVRALIAHMAGREEELRPLAALAWPYLGRLGQRIARLHALWQAGRLPKPRAPRPLRPRPTPPRPRLRLPSRQGWLAHAIRPLAQYSPLVETQINHPEMIAFVQAAPQAARLLRPLCRMFFFAPPPHLALPARPRKPRPSRCLPRGPDGLTDRQRQKAEHRRNFPPTPKRFHLQIPNLKKYRR